MTVLFYVIGVIVFVIPFWKIFEKAGFNPVFSLVMVIPIVNLVALYVLAFADWPDRVTIVGTRSNIGRGAGR